MEHGQFQHLVEYVGKSKIISNWHWFSFHFSKLVAGEYEPFAFSILEASIACEPYLPGFSKEFVDSLASISGKEKDVRQYEQLLQKLSELLIIRQIVTHPWPPNPRFESEPKAGSSKKNPEISVNYPGAVLGIEVKMPSLLDHIEKRTRNRWQMASRGPWFETVKSIEEPKKIVLPRDNPVKDFLISSNEKFREFRNVEADFRGVLVIVWDDHIYEPISALLAPEGLFMENSWAKDDDGKQLLFENVDGVIIVRHIHQFVRASKCEPLIDGKDGALDYGRARDYPYKAFICNPNGRGVPDTILECLQAYTPTAEMGAEYVPGEVVIWVGQDEQA